MPYPLEDFEREATANLLARLTPEKLVARLTPEQQLAGLSLDQRMDGLPLAEIEKYLQERKAASKRSSPERPDTPL